MERNNKLNEEKNKLSQRQKQAYSQTLEEIIMKIKENQENSHEKKNYYINEISNLETEIRANDEENLKFENDIKSLRQKRLRFAIIIRSKIHTLQNLYDFCKSFISERHGISNSNEIQQSARNEAQRFLKVYEQEIRQLIEDMEIELKIRNI